MAVRRLVAVAPGLVIAGAGVAAVAGLADSARESDGLAADDPRLANDVLGLRTVELTDVARALTFLGDVPVLMVFTLIAALVLWRVTRSRTACRAAARRDGRLCARSPMASSCWSSGRGRASAMCSGAVDTSYSFPSGHTLNSAVFFLTMAGLLWMLRAGRGVADCRYGGRRTAQRGDRASRIYLGYHWATDVLAGWLLAATWLSLVATGAYLHAAPGG